MRIGFRMRQLESYVRAHPYCSIRQAVVTIYSEYALRFGYNAMHRAAKAGLVVLRRNVSTGVYSCMSPEVAEGFVPVRH